MCGINIIYGQKDKEKSKAAILKMNAALAHRGPNDEGCFVEADVALGQRRLSIIDLSDAGHQPMFSHDKRFAIVYNGELYNYKEIKRQLSDYPFSTNSDTEVVLAAYAQWGTECLQHFNGMFAFGIWDQLKEEIFVARDRLGIKPLYYYQKRGRVLFSSELKALLASDSIPKKLNEEGLVDYLRYQTVHAPQTIIKNVQMLLPGHYLLVNQNNFFSSELLAPLRYWNPIDNIDPTVEKKNYDEVCKDVNELLTKAVERQLVADVPFGAFLSGGIDSSAIVALMSKVATGPVKTFSVTFDEEEYSEGKYARMVAEKFNTEHHEIRLSINDFLNDLPLALKSLDHPSGDGPNTWIVSKATKKEGITMALSGLGGDELFAGYSIFKRTMRMRNLSWMAKMPYAARMQAGNLLTKIKKGVVTDKIAALLKTDKWDIASVYHLSRQVMLDEQIRKITNYDDLVSNRVIEISKKLQLKYLDSHISRISILEMYTYMQNVLLRDADQMSMAHALEVRVPFLDHTLVEYVLSIHDRFKTPVTPKKLLVDSLDDLLPPKIVNRPKMGFTFPWKDWLKIELRDFCEEKISSLSRRSMFNKQEVLNLWTSFLLDDPRVPWSRIWYLVVLENWLVENQIES